MLPSYTWRKKIVVLLFIFCILLIPTLSGIAQETTDEASIEDDLFLQGDEINIIEPVDGDVIAIGRTINVDGPISGSLVAIGRDIFINNSINGSLYSMGVKLELNESAYIGRSVYYIGLRFLSNQNSRIERDLTVLSLSSSMSGSIGRNIDSIFGIFEIFKAFQSQQDTNVEPTDIQDQQNDSGGNFDGINSATMLTTTNIKLASLTKLPIIKNVANDLQNQGTINTIQAKSDQIVDNQFLVQAEQQETPLPKWLISSIDTFVTLLVFGLLAIWLIPSWVKNSAAVIRNKPLKSTGYGLLGIVISVNMVGVVLLLGIIIGAIGFFLGVILIWSLAWSVWVLGFSSLAIATTLFALFVLFISKIIVAYFIGFLILDRISPKVSKYRALCLILGLLIYALLIAIPYIGWVIGVLVTALGLGAAWIAYLHQRQVKKTAKIEEDKHDNLNLPDEAAESDPLVIEEEKKDE